MLVFVGKVAPEVSVGGEVADRLEGERLEPPGLEFVMPVRRPFGVDE